jgi:hypothetical protein
MKIEIVDEDGKKIKLHVPLFRGMAGIAAGAICKYTGVDLKQEKQEASEKQPSKQEVKRFLSAAIGILKKHKGLVLVEVEDHGGEHVKITI